ncbi:hypothetical protein H310_12836 [Aphanomyces invadans]|uniref:Kinesin motor domain-containing protein n=1 Tax=Aphanomyces invadans TaxID=157072 RepID=A0A024TG38_9STRA|nr:hypothetical protein H310_12836 [Aphanomyces invadans]ETV92998.1 hypothetical protein H310_12836 [Aphanomyces invadans]|eukprot:XP_008878263.1 hypothetical protein H310_12836 [Aphanomyces invadans]
MTTSAGTAPVPQRARIGVRIRPWMQDEEGAKYDKNAWTWHNRTISQQIFPADCTSPSAEASAFERRVKEPPTAYTFDRLFPPETSTAVVYASLARGVVMDAMRGAHNGLVVVYGQANSGKTYSVQGKGGMIGLALRDIFEHVHEQRHTAEYAIQVAYVDIGTDERMHDLLAPSPSKTARVVHGPRGNFQLAGHTEELVTSLGHALAVLDAGIAKQGRHGTAHTVLRVTIASQARTKAASPAAPRRSPGNLNPVHVAVLDFVDLAASESVTRAVVPAPGDGRSPGLNKSLLAFGHIMWKRSHETMTHHPMIERADLPYGDSQLTRLLEPSLGPHASLAMLCTISPSLPCLTETHNTLKFASRAKRIHYTLRPSDSMERQGTIDGNVRATAHRLHRVLLPSDEVQVTSNVPPSRSKRVDGTVDAAGDGLIVCRRSTTICCGSSRPSLAPSDDDGDSSAWDDPDAVPPSDNGTAQEDNAAVHAATLDLLRRKISRLSLDPDDASMLLHGLLVLERAYRHAALPP